MADALTQALDALVDAEARACEVKDVLTVMHMAVGFETGGLDADQRSGIETVTGLASKLTVASMEAASKARLLVERCRA